MAITIKCDRCGNSIKMYGDRSKKLIVGMVPILQEKADMIYDTTESMDLCEKCYTSLKDWSRTVDGQDFVKDDLY